MPNDKDFELDDLESFSFDDLSLDDEAAPETPVQETPSEEDPLGVWVKSAPEDVAAEDSLDIPEIPPPAPTGDLAEEDFLSSEELAKLDDSFEFVTVSEEPLAGETDLDEDMAFLDTPEAVAAEQTAKETESEPSFNEVSLDDFVTFDDVSLEDAPEVEAKSEEEALEDEAFEDEFLDIDIDIDDDINDEELEILEGNRPKEQPAEPKTGVASQDIDLSEFVDFEEVSPSQEAGAEASLAGEEELTLPALEQQEGYFEESVLEEPLPPLVDEGPVVLDTDLEPDDVTDMDHIRALEADLTSGIRQPEPAGAGDLAAQILGKIEQELSSIKQEISDLKKEMTNLRVAPSAPEAPIFPPAAEPAPESDEALAAEAAKSSHGFFDEEDDETIALTGDELDNILSTAEVSEGEETGVSLDEDLLDTDAEGNLIEPQITEEEDAHVTDEEFLAGTGLDIDDPAFDVEVPQVPLTEEEEADDEPTLGVPDSIELEENFPEGLDEGETENLLDVPPAEESPLTEISFEEDQGLESVDLAPLAPELTDELPGSADWDEEEVVVPEVEAKEPSDTDSEGWTAPLAQDEAPAFQAPEPPLPPPPAAPPAGSALTSNVKEELRAVLSYMDKLLASLPDDKIQEFAESEHFEVYKRLFEELGLIE